MDSLKAQPGDVETRIEWVRVASVRHAQAMRLARAAKTAANQAHSRASRTESDLEGAVKALGAAAQGDVFTYGDKPWTPSFVDDPYLPKSTCECERCVALDDERCIMCGHRGRLPVPADDWRGAR